MRWNGRVSESEENGGSRAARREGKGTAREDKGAPPTRNRKGGERSTRAEDEGDTLHALCRWRKGKRRKGKRRERIKPLPTCAELHVCCIHSEQEERARERRERGGKEREQQTRRAGSVRLPCRERDSTPMQLACDELFLSEQARSHAYALYIFSLHM